MTSFKLPSTEDKAAFVQDQFDRIAGRYDLTNDVISLGMHRRWKARAVDELVCRPGGSYLDVCCGTGDLALTIAGRLQGNGQVTGLDFSGNMLDIAGQRFETARGKGLAALPVSWVQGDAQKLPFPDGTFDGAIISFGLRNLTNLSGGIQEMARVVKSGGRVVNLDLGHASFPLFAQLFHIYFFHIVPIIGDILQGDRQAYTYLPESLRSYPKPAEISAMFEKAGLRNVRHYSLACGSVALHVGTVI